MPTTEKKQKPLSLIFLTCTVLLIVAVIGIFMMQKSTMTTKKITDASPCQYDKQVCAFLKKVQNPTKFYTGPITATIAITSPTNTTDQIMLQTDSKNNFYITSTQNGKMQAELLTIGTTVYKKDAKGVWQKQVNLTDETIMKFKDKALQEVNRSGPQTTYTFVREEPCGRYMCVTYIVDSPELSATKQSITFDTTDYLLRKVLLENKNGSITETNLAYTSLTITPPTQ